MGYASVKILFCEVYSDQTVRNYLKRLKTHFGNGPFYPWTWEYFQMGQLLGKKMSPKRGEFSEIQFGRFAQLSDLQTMNAQQ